MEQTDGQKSLSTFILSYEESSFIKIAGTRGTIEDYIRTVVEKELPKDFANRIDECTAIITDIGILLNQSYSSGRTRGYNTLDTSEELSIERELGTDRSQHFFRLEDWIKTVAINLFVYIVSNFSDFFSDRLSVTSIILGIITQIAYLSQHHIYIEDKDFCLFGHIFMSNKTGRPVIKSEIIKTYSESKYCFMPNTFKNGRCPHLLDPGEMCELKMNREKINSSIENLKNINVISFDKKNNNKINLYK